MAFDFSKLNFIKRLDARSRVFLLLASLIGIIFLVYLSTRFFSSSSTTGGGSQVPTAPVGPSIQGNSKLTAEYATALREANTQASQQAQITGKSAVYTMTNAGEQTSGCIICSDQSANVKTNLDDWVKQGAVTPETAAALEELADKNVPVSQYADYLNQLVKEGKLTPEQARELLEQYKKQHANNLLQDSAKLMDGMIKGGTLPLESANQLLMAQKNGISPSDYAKRLRELEKLGKISGDISQQLLTQYTQQRAKEIIQMSIASLQRMRHDGQITQEVEKSLIDLENRVVAIDTYQAALQEFIKQGKLIPATADKILAEFKMQKAAIGPIGAINQMLKNAENAAFAELNELLKENKITEETAGQLRSLIDQNVTLEKFIAVVNQLEQDKKLTPEIAQLKIADYRAVKGLRDMADRLGAMQGNNAPPGSYADELKRLVQAGVITPEQAAQLMQEYQAASGRGGAVATTGFTTEDFAKLRARMAQTPTTNVPSDEFARAEVQGQQESAQERAERLNALAEQMSGQAKDLISLWQPTKMEHKEGVGEKTEASSKLGAGGLGKGEGSEASKAEAPVIIKSGTIIFAVLDTEANSDYPDSPIMATVVDGKLKGAKLLGKLTTTKGVAGQQDRISLNFTMMNMDEWPKSKGITAYAIDPDTARTVLASDVDYHYLQRYGAIMATSFVQGYANAIATSSSTTSTGIFGTSTTHPELSPSQKLATALGQIGQNLGSVTQNYVNIPPTVKVASGVSLGILFMADVS